MATSDSIRSNLWHIAVLSGGDSPERVISLESGAAVATALQRRGHQVTRIDPAEFDLTDYRWDDIDVAFLALHGHFGEDGQVQQILETAGIAYPGSDSAASRLAFSKSASKERFLQCGVPTPAYVLVHESDASERIREQAKRIGFPLVVKPDGQGSSLGVSIVHSADELPDALARCFYFDAFGILEAAVIGSEWTVGILDDVTLPPIQIETDRGFFDYAAKYEDEATRYLFDSAVPPDVKATIEETGRRACSSLGTQGLARVDIMLDSANRPWTLEINTIPGLTSHSLIPKAAARVGMELGVLCERTIESCLKVAAERPQS